MSGRAISIVDTPEGVSVQITDLDTDAIVGEANDLDDLGEALGYVRRFMDAAVSADSPYQRHRQAAREHPNAKDERRAYHDTDRPYAEVAEQIENAIAAFKRRD